MTQKEYLKPMCISLVLMALQQLSGINYVVGYSKEIFEVKGNFICFIKEINSERWRKH